MPADTLDHTHACGQAAAKPETVQACMLGTPHVGRHEEEEEATAK